jgi:hypothetical protein
MQAILPINEKPKTIRKTTETRRKKPPKKYYPKSDQLPWHTSWIDDLRIGGMSLPVK